MWKYLILENLKSPVEEGRQESYNEETVKTTDYFIPKLRTTGHRYEKLKQVLWQQDLENPRRNVISSFLCQDVEDQ